MSTDVGVVIERARGRLRLAYCPSRVEFEYRRGYVWRERSGTWTKTLRSFGGNVVGARPCDSFQDALAFFRDWKKNRGRG